MPDVRITDRVFDLFRLRPADDSGERIEMQPALSWEGEIDLPASDLDPLVIVQRWGAGKYIAQIWDTTRKPSFLGQTRMFEVFEDGNVRQLVAPSERTGRQAAATPSAAAATAPVASSPVAPPLPPIGGDPLSILKWMEARADYERARADREVERERARIRAETDQAIARERSETEARIKREQQYGQLMLAQQQSFFEAMTKLKAPEPDRGLERALERINDRLDDIEEERDEPPPATSDTAQIIAAVKEVGGVVLPLVVEHMAKGQTGGAPVLAAAGNTNK